MRDKRDLLRYGQTASAVVCWIAPSVILLICMGEIIQDGSGDAKDRDLRLEYMDANPVFFHLPEVLLPYPLPHTSTNPYSSFLSPPLPSAFPAFFGFR